MGRKAYRAVDLDGTLAYYTKYAGATVIGKPIEPMLAQVKKWLENGDRVAIFTSRVDPSAKDHREATLAVEHWCKIHIGRILLVTAVKSKDFTHFYDDRAQQVIKNKGIIVESPNFDEIITDINDNGNRAESIRVAGGLNGNF